MSNNGLWISACTCIFFCRCVDLVIYPSLEGDEFALFAGAGYPSDGFVFLG